MSRPLQSLPETRVESVDDADREIRQLRDALSELQGVVQPDIDATRDPNKHGNESHSTDFASALALNTHKAAGLDDHGDTTLAELNSIISGATLADVDAGTWTPRFNVGGTTFTTSYADQDGWYLRVGDTVAIGAYLRRTLSASSDVVGVTNLPFGRSTTLAHDPAWVGVCALNSGNIWPRFSSSTIWLNDSGDNLSTTNWTFSSFDTFVSVGAIYRRA